MDILASHRSGLIEQYRTEARGLAGRPKDGVQRAMVQHHLYDHSGGRHAYALLCAEAALALPEALERLAAKARRARWRLGAARAAALTERLAAFGETLREIDRARCEAMWTLSRLVVAPALGDDGAIPAEIATASECGDGRALFLAYQGWVEAEWGLALEQAIAALDWPLAPRSVAEAIAAIRLPIEAYERAAQKGWARTEQRIKAAPALPRGFAANPAHHYFALQRAMAERRRRAMGEGLDALADETVRLAA